MFRRNAENKQCIYFSTDEMFLSEQSLLSDNDEFYRRDVPNGTGLMNENDEFYRQDVPIGTGLMNDRDDFYPQDVPIGTKLVER